MLADTTVEAIIPVETPAQMKIWAILPVKMRQATHCADRRETKLAPEVESLRAPNQDLRRRHNTVVLTIIGNKQARKTAAIAVTLPIPNHKANSG
jgi:hypothetical protein